MRAALMAVTGACALKLKSEERSRKQREKVRIKGEDILNALSDVWTQIEFGTPGEGLEGNEKGDTPAEFGRRQCGGKPGVSPFSFHERSFAFQARSNAGSTA
jgi:hypothetical protein